MPTLSPRLGVKKAKKQLKPKHASAEYKSLYDWRWRQYSKQYRVENPLCVCDECKERVVPLPSEVVDHIKPHKGNIKLFWDETNHQAMAKVCHDKKTVREDGGFGNKPKTIK